jgi:hypothetical protein
MAKWCKRIFENLIDWEHIIGVAKVEIGQKSKAFYIEEWWIV